MTNLIMELIKHGDFAKFKQESMNVNPVDLAHAVEELETEKLLLFFRLLPKDIAADVFAYMSSEQQQKIIEAVTDKEIKNIIDKLFFDDTIDMIEEMPSNVVKKILKNSTPDMRKLINQFLNYPEDSAGSIMTIEYVDIKKEWTVKQSLDRIKKTGIDKATIETCYVLDNKRKLDGIVPLRTLILSDEDTIIEEIMYSNIISVNTHSDQEYVANLFKKYDFIAMPVVDNENRLVGIITIDDIVDIIDMENTEDLQKMAAMQPSEKPYLKTSIFALSKHRILWLLVLMLTATVTGAIIKRYDDTLQSVVILAAFIPMLMDTAGNAGSQSSTLIIRGLALNEIRLKDIFKVLWKELGVSLVVGFLLAFVNFLRILLIESTSLRVNLTVSITLYITVILAKVVGGALPIIAKKLKVDPAIMAGPLITTIVDTMALLIYFTIASWLLNI